MKGHTSLLVILFLAYPIIVGSQAKGLILHNDTWGTEGAFPCVSAVADISFDYCTFPGGFTSIFTPQPCFNLDYEVIFLNATYVEISPAVMQDFVSYLQSGGNLFFQHNCIENSNYGINANMKTLLDAINQPEVTYVCNDFDGHGSAVEINSIHDIYCPDTYDNVDYIDGGTLIGPGLAESYMVSISEGVCLAFWHTGYGGILGIGSEYYSSGNAGFGGNVGCTTDSGPIIWGFMDPEDPSCLECMEPTNGCDDGDCLNGLEYWSEDDCDCLTEMVIDPGCDDGDCTNGLETWNGCECIDGIPPVDPGCDDGDCNNGLETWNGCECVDGTPFLDPGCDDLDCTNGVEIWNGCDCETVIAIVGCTDPFAENYDPDANCNDGSCFINNNYYIPNVFSPSDSNPLNSQFQIQGNNIDQIQWNIYDRWGNLIYEGNDLNDHWIGNFNGQKVTQGVYVYYGSLKFLNGEEVEFKGSVTFVE